MTLIQGAQKLQKHWLVHLILMFLFYLPGVAQQRFISVPLTADEVMKRVGQMNEQRAKALQGYSSLRTYHLECHCLSHKKADMVVRAEFQAPDRKEFKIISESGSGTLRERVFKKLLEAEQESMRDDNQRRSAITSENYTFRLVSYDESDTTTGFYVLDAQPRTNNKFLFRGRIWVDSKDFAITRVQGEPAVNPSWWTVKTDFNRSYRKVGEFWLPESNQSETKVRIFGTAVLSIAYGEYSITPAGPSGRTVVSGDASQLSVTKGF